MNKYMVSFENVQKHIRSSWEKSVKKKDQRSDFVLPYDFIPPLHRWGFNRFVLLGYLFYE